jgi:sucrose-6-phosphate hydrolase SacC (GH32 family)
LLFEKYIRVYFCTRPSPNPQGQYMSYLSYLDLSRANLIEVVDICHKPILSLGGLGTFDEFGTNPVSVIRDGDVVRVYYAGWTRCESVPFNSAIGMAVSNDDGQSFVRIGTGPVISHSPDEPFLLGSPRIRKFGDTWYLWYVSGTKWLNGYNGGKPEPVYKIRLATSSDGINWTKQGRNLIENVLGENECQAGADVIFKNDRFHMFFSYRLSHNYRGKVGGYRIGYAWSEDMSEWHRNDAMAGILPSEEGWDSEMTCYPHVFIVDGTTYMLYQGNEMGRTGMGLAKLVSPVDWSSL